MKVSLAVKGLILIAVPLTFELVLVGALITSLRHTDERINQELKNKAAVEHTTILMRQIGLCSSMAFLSPVSGDSNSFNSSTVEQAIDDSLQELIELTANDTTLQSICQKIKATSKRLLKTANDLARLPKITLLQSFTDDNSGFSKIFADSADLDRYFKIIRLSAAAENLESSAVSTTRTVILTGVLLSLFITVILALGFARDVSARLKRLAENTRRISSKKPPFSPMGDDDELGILDSVIHRMSSQLQAAEIQRRQLTSMVRDKLQDPLSEAKKILFKLQAQNDSMPSTAIDWIRKSSDQLVRLIDLLDDLTELEYMDSNHIELNKTNLRSEELLKESLDAVNNLAAKKAVKIQSSGPNLAFSGDGKRLSQVLINLLTNAIKFSPPRETIIVEVVDVDNEIGFSVRDHGPGIPQELQSKIFGRFQQANRQDATARGGAGLGLNICSIIAQSHGGTLEVKSEPGKGSEFCLQIPKYLSGNPGLERIDPEHNRKGAALSPSVSGHFKLKIWHKGLIVIAVPLVFQVSFLCVLNNMFAKAYSEAIREMHARQISTLANKLFRDHLRICVTAGAIHIFGNQKRDYLASGEEVKSVLKGFCELFELEKGNNAAQQKICKVLRKSEKVLRCAGSLVADPASESNISSLALMQLRSTALQKEMLSMATSISDLFEEQRRIELWSGIARARTREAIELVIAGAVAASVLLSLILGAYFSKNISRRVAVLIENTVRFTDGKKELLPPLSGEDEISCFDSDFRQMIARIEKSQDFKRHIFAVVSHELRTPLTSIHGSIYLLLQGAYGEIAPANAIMVQNAFQNIAQVVQLVSDLLDLERIEAGKFPLELESVYLTDAVLGAIDNVMDEIPEAQLVAESSVLKPQVKADPVLFAKSISALLRFCLHWQSEPQPIHIQLSDDDDFCSIRVLVRCHPDSDTSDRIFKKFHFLEQSEGQDLKGASLSLALCQTIVTQMGGRVSCSLSDESRTLASFIISLPKQVDPHVVCYGLQEE